MITQTKHYRFRYLTYQCPAVFLQKYTHCARGRLWRQPYILWLHATHRKLLDSFSSLAVVTYFCAFTYLTYNVIHLPACFRPPQNIKYKSFRIASSLPIFLRNNAVFKFNRCTYRNIPNSLLDVDVVYIVFFRIHFVFHSSDAKSDATSLNVCARNYHVICRYLYMDIYVYISHIPHPIVIPRMKMHIRYLTYGIRLTYSSVSKE